MYALNIVSVLAVVFSFIINSNEYNDCNENISTTENPCCSTTTSIKRCPEGLLPLTSGICYTLIKNQTFPPKCPYQNNLPYHKTLFVFEILELNGEDIWINAIRNNSANFGNFEWIERSEYFGETIRNDISATDFERGYNCLFVQRGVFVPTNCTDYHKTLCVYAYNSSQYCTNNYGKGSCIASHFDFYNGECYCKEDLKNPMSKQNQTCKELAEPKYPFQTHMLMQSFSGFDKCWFGLNKIENCVYSWISKTEPLEYTYWSNNVDCNYNEGAISFIENGGWILFNDTLLDCSICYVEIEPKMVTLELYHDLNNDILNLIIKNPLSLTDWNGKFDVYCFSTTNTEDFKYKIKIDVNGLSANDTVAIINIPAIVGFPGHYWCSAFQFPYNDLVHSNTIVTYNRTNRYGFEYTLILEIQTFGGDPLQRMLHVHVCNYIFMSLAKVVSIMSVRPMGVINFNDTEESLVIIAHITTKETGQIHFYEYYTLLQSLYVLNLSHPKFYIGDFLSTSVCFPDFTITPDGDVLEWPETNIGVTAIPINKLCLDSTSNSLPVTRKCEGSFMFGAKWSDVQGSCEKNPKYSETTKELFYLLKLEKLVEGIEEILADITAHNDNNSVIDVYLISQILSTIAEQNNKVNEHFFMTIDNLMAYNKVLLNNSQVVLNSTDHVLFSLDNILMQFNDTVDYKSRNLIVRVIDLKPVNSVSIVLQNENQTDNNNNFNSYNISIFFDNQYHFEKGGNVEVAIRISSRVLEHIKNQIKPENPLKLVIAVFNNDFLFNQQDDLNDYYVGNKVVSISWIGFNGYLKWPIQVMFKKENGSMESSKCGYWDYGWDQLMISKYGRWAFDNSSFNKSTDVEFCEFYHTTHFGLLLINTSSNIPSYHEKYLQILFGVGSSLSLFGIIPIFLTAIFHKPWRRRPATKILIQLCLTIVIQTSLLFLSDLVTKDGVLCKMVGVFLHYIVLAEFCWMFVIGLLQYRKFVVIMKPPPSNVLQMSSLIGWGVPIVPIFITLAISTDNYAFINKKFCYLHEKYVILFMLLPITVMYLANVYIFVRIFYSISRVNAGSVVKVKHFKAEIFLAILLFFILGLTWIFVDCIYQRVRFVIFFIVRNKEVRHLWVKETNAYLDSSKDKGFSEISAENSSHQEVGNFPPLLAPCPRTNKITIIDPDFSIGLYFREKYNLEEVFENMMEYPRVKEDCPEKFE
ncbi:hypothetical protein FQR65_LT01033 [Abscondita terminalis]|nr:hypothetical protein FQR65_LT01033 [Abscondita terminalis]